MAYIRLCQRDRLDVDDERDGQGHDARGGLSSDRIICECKGVSDVQIEELVKSGKALTFDELSAQTGCSTACGKCRGRIIEALEEYRHIYGK